MRRTIQIKEGYLYIPVYTGREVKTITISVLEEEHSLKKVFEFNIPVDMTKEEEYFGDYLAEIPVRKYIGQTFVIEGDFPMIMGMRIENSIKRKQYMTNRPRIHFTVNRGWTNDPNGLVYYKGLYHMYFQYNPFDIVWNNMTWGHAISKDMLHWVQLDSVMFPDEDGAIFSGCGLINERKMLDLPEDALLFYYTAAGGCNPWSEGKEFTQKIAYSCDMGESLIKIEKPCLNTLFRDNRDPKVFWHEETAAYIMVLWLKGNDFGIFRSTDLTNWQQTQEVYLEDGWECPDLFCLTSPEGQHKWFFWSADGFYYPGDFDGYTFTNYGERHTAYVNKIPYAAQTFSGVEGRVISIPWLRMENDGRLFTGSYGVATEMSYINDRGRSILVQKPIKEFYEQLVAAREECIIHSDCDVISYHNPENDRALYCSVDFRKESGEQYHFHINGSEVSYSPSSGSLHIDGEKYQVGLDYHKMEMIIDDRILEIIFDDGIRLGTFILKDRFVSFSTRRDRLGNISFCEIC